MGEASRVMCVGCGYDLFGLDTRGPCPECGRPIEESVFRPKLWEADAVWLRRQMAGMWLLVGVYAMSVAGTVGWVVFSWLLSDLLGMASLYWVTTALGTLMSAVLWMGVGWLLSRANPMRGVPEAEVHWRRTLEAVTWMVAVVCGVVAVAQVVVFGLRSTSVAFGMEVAMVMAVMLWVGVWGVNLWALVKYVWTMWKWPELTPCGREADLFLPVLVIVTVLGAAVATLGGRGMEYLIGLTSVSVLWALADWLGDAGAKRSVRVLFFVQIAMGFVSPVVMLMSALLPLRGVGWVLGPVVFNLLLMVFTGGAVWRIVKGIREGRRASLAMRPGAGDGGETGPSWL